MNTPPVMILGPHIETVCRVLMQPRGWLTLGPMRRLKLRSIQMPRLAGIDMPSLMKSQSFSALSWGDESLRELLSAKDSWLCMFIMSPGAVFSVQHVVITWVSMNWSSCSTETAGTDRLHFCLTCTVNTCLVCIFSQWPFNLGIWLLNRLKIYLIEIKKQLKRLVDFVFQSCL